MTQITGYKEKKEFISNVFNVACEKGMFRTFAAMFRKHYDPYFTAADNAQVLNGMTFQEWASYLIGDGNYGDYEMNQETFDAFKKDAEDKILDKTLLEILL